MSENRKKENRECKNSVFVDLFYENESAAENDIAYTMRCMMNRSRRGQR